MKKVTSLLMAIFCAVTFSMAAFADSAEVQPRAAECPFCGSNGWSVTRVGRRAMAPLKFPAHIINMAQM